MSIHSNEARCTSCHAGYGWKDSSFDFTDMTKIDCLVCHETTGDYKKAPGKAGMPDPGVDLVKCAKSVGHSTRKSCGDCHFYAGCGEIVKYGDLSELLVTPDRNNDIHMGGYDFQCSECHRTRKHQIAGRSSPKPVVEATRSCENCHTDAPHYGDDLLDHHLNEHSQSVACATCHAPVYSRNRPTKVFWDWSKAGDKDRKPKIDKYGMPDYHWTRGEFVWKECVKPIYEWYSGFARRILLGDRVDIDAPYISLAEPLGSMSDPDSRIAPFRMMEGVQAVDEEYAYLLVPHLFPKGEGDKTAFWEYGDWQKAFTEGMKAADIPYSGKYKWVKTRMYWDIHHEIMPAEAALSCAQCHETLNGEETCDRCHDEELAVEFKALVPSGTDFKTMAARGRDVNGLIGVTNYIDFEALGYEGDPIEFGGR